jgi:hypothetical protein
MLVRKNIFQIPILLFTKVGNYDETELFVAKNYSFIIKSIQN